MGYFFLVLTILTETIAVICMKMSDGFQHRVYAIAAVITYALGFVFLSLSLKTLPAGLANAVWAGASTVLVAVLSYFIFDDKFTTVQIISILLITIGLVGLNAGK